jgi:glycosyltransferase involved in cell wall biosynthesis
LGYGEKTVSDSQIISSRPLVSVIVPAFNAVATLETSIHSLMAQTLQELEILLVDDGSSDGSLEKIHDLARLDPRIKPLEMGQNVGVHEARSAALKCATGRWVGFLDADDYARPTMFEVLYKAGEDSEASIVVCGVNLVTPSREVIAPKVHFAHDARIENHIFARFCRLEFRTGSLCNKLYRRELVCKYGTMPFRWRQNTNEDMLVNIGCFLDARFVQIVASNLYDYVQRCESVTQTTKPATAFTQLLRAYALAVELFADRGEGVLSLIDQLYQNQLAHACYHIEAASDLIDLTPDVKEAVMILATYRPITLASMANRGLWRSTARPTSFNEQWCEWKESSGQLVKFLLKALNRNLTQLF